MHPLSSRCPCCLQTTDPHPNSPSGQRQFRLAARIAMEHTCGSILLPEACEEAMRNCPACQIDISKALAIKGYMQPSELEWLANEATTHERIAEIGAYYGRST